MHLVPPGSEISHERGPRHIARHHHVAAYAAIVLRGDYVEAGDHGRFRAAAGTVLIHDWFEAHQDHFGASGADILNLPLEQAVGPAVGRVGDADALARLAKRDWREAAELLLETLQPAETDCNDWPDLLAAELRRDQVRSLGDWARGHGLAPSSVSRGFRACYGVSPQRYRLEQRAGRAARAARRRSVSLAQIAAGAGFADQAHLTRTVRRLYGERPSRLRCGHVNCVQDGAAARL